METQQPHIDPASSVEQNQNPQNKNKIYKTWLPLAFLIVLFAGWYLWSKSQEKTGQDNSPIAQSTGISREQKLAALNERERATLEKKLEALEGEIKAFTDKTSQEDKDKKYIQISGTQRSLGLYEESLASLAKVSSEYKSQSRIYLGYALTYKDMGDAVKTAENAQRAVELDPENHQSWILYLESAQNLSNEERLAKYKDAVLRTDYHADVLVSYAQFLTKIDKTKEAIEQYKKAGEQDPKRKPEFDQAIARLEGK